MISYIEVYRILARKATILYIASNMYSTKDEDDWYDCPFLSKMKYGSLLKKWENSDFFPCNLTFF